MPRNKLAVDRPEAVNPAATRDAARVLSLPDLRPRQRVGRRLPQRPIKKDRGQATGYRSGHMRMS